MRVRVTSTHVLTCAHACNIATRVHMCTCMYVRPQHMCSYVYVRVCTCSLFARTHMCTCIHTPKDGQTGRHVCMHTCMHVQKKQKRSDSMIQLHLTRARQSLDWKSVLPVFEEQHLSLLVSRGASVFGILSSAPLSPSELSRWGPAASLRECGPLSSSKAWPFPSSGSVLFSNSELGSSVTSQLLLLLGSSGALLIGGLEMTPNFLVLFPFLEVWSPSSKVGVSPSSELLLPLPL